VRLSKYKYTYFGKSGAAPAGRGSPVEQQQVKRAQTEQHQQPHHEPEQAPVLGEITGL